MDKLTKNWIKDDLKNDYIVAFKKDILSIIIMDDKQECIVKVKNEAGIEDYIGTLKRDDSGEYYIHWELLEFGWENLIC